MKIPDWWSFTLLGLASWRTFQLLAFDVILNQPRAWLLKMGEWREGDDPHAIPEDYRFELAKFITCPYCLGAWIAMAWWGAWQISNRWTDIVASLVALWVIPIAGHKLLAREEDK